MEMWTEMRWEMGMGMGMEMGDTLTKSSSGRKSSPGSNDRDL